MKEQQKQFPHVLAVHVTFARTNIIFQPEKIPIAEDDTPPLNQTSLQKGS